MLVTVIVLCLSQTAFPIMGAREADSYVPEVSYIAPESESIVDISGVKHIEFSWKPTPIPALGRQAYRFTLYKGYGYDVVCKKELDEEARAVSVPAALFEKGGTYTWSVKQRSRGIAGWSDGRRWSFTVAE
ncbi:MAG: hypothetical protein ABH885_00615 [Candidatus Omnitrophota bacterium]